MIGLGVAAFNVLAAGHIRSDAEEERRRQTGEKGRMLTQSTWERTEDERKMSKALEVVAKQVGAKSITAGMSALIFFTRSQLIRDVIQSPLPTSCKRLRTSSPSSVDARSST